TANVSGGTIQVTHNFQLTSADFSPSGGTVQFISPGGGTFVAGTYQFFHVLIDSGVDPGMDQNAVTIRVAGNWTNNGTGTLTAKATTLVFNGNAAQTIAGS